MRRFALIAVIIVWCALAFATSAQDARSELNAGVEAYKAGRLDEAVTHFQAVVLLEPQLLVGHLYLGTALAQQYVPGVEEPSNKQIAEHALEEFHKVLDLDADNLNALKAIGALSFQLKRFEEARQYQEKVIAHDPKDEAAYYTIGVIRWIESYQPRMELRSKLGLKPDEALILLPECGQVREANWDKVEAGIRSLSRALGLRPDYDDAMAYLNLLYHERADLQCGDPVAREKDLATADEWVDKTMQVKRAKRRPN
ncbi:MAG TPA: tetratricopeptide repeat protein [Terriglobales bacterium]|nr:tetratricopeptide repeat protein [Terriglobales bacterium]